MDIKYIRSKWGMTETPLRAILEKIKEAGFDGVEMGAPECSLERAEAKSILCDLDLLFVGQQWSRGSSVTEHIDSFKRQFDANMELNPLHINSHTGKDWYLLEDNIKIFRAAIEHANGAPLVHETHRGRALFSTNSTLALLERIPELRLCADFSHWCCVHESFLEDQKERVEKSIERVDYFHARVGHTQCSQINDPRAHEWQHALEAHTVWWDAIVAKNKEAGVQTLYCCPEFGPYPYMTETPHERKPLADLWDINFWMFEYLKNRYS